MFCSVEGTGCTRKTDTSWKIKKKERKKGEESELERERQDLVGRITHSLPHPLTPSPTHSLTHPLPHPLPPSLVDENKLLKKII